MIATTFPSESGHNMLTPERRAQMDAALKGGTQTSVLTPERRAQMDAVLAGGSTAPTTAQPTQTQPGGFQSLRSLVAYHISSKAMYTEQTILLRKSVILATSVKHVLSV